MVSGFALPISRNYQSARTGSANQTQQVKPSLPLVSPEALLVLLSVVCDK